MIDKFPMILDDEQTTGGDIVDFIKGYRRVLDQFDERLDDDFPLWDVIENFDRESDFTEDIAAHRKRKGLPPLYPPAAPADAEPTPAPAEASAAESCGEGRQRTRRDAKQKPRIRRQRRLRKLRRPKRRLIARRSNRSS